VQRGVLHPDILSGNGAGLKSEFVTLAASYVLAV
jgi:hypothetical protein